MMIYIYIERERDIHMCIHCITRNIRHHVLVEHGGGEVQRVVGEAQRAGEVYIYIYIYIYTHTYIYIYIYIYVYIYIYIYIHVYVYVYLCIASYDYVCYHY